MKTDERRDYGDTTYKRLFWQGFKGRFGVFSWPTTWMDTTALKLLGGEFPDFTDEWIMRNFDDGEMKAYASAGALRTLIKTLDGRYSVNLFAHSMGNIVASEALRQEATSPAPQHILHTYVASEAAMSAAAYDPGVLNSPDGVLTRTENTPVPDIYSNFPDTGKPYFADIGLATDKAYNFFNPHDGAVAAFLAWPFNQAMKPNEVALRQPTGIYLSYHYNANNTAKFSEKATQPTGFGTFNTLWWNALDLGNAYDAYAAMAYIAPSRSTGLGATADVHGAFTTAGQINLQTSFSRPNNDFSDTREDHSAPFDQDNQTRFMYWNVMLKRFGLVAPATSLDRTPTLGGRV